MSSLVCSVVHNRHLKWFVSAIIWQISDALSMELYDKFIQKGKKTSIVTMEYFQESIIKKIMFGRNQILA